jgi:hypothetical protein
MGPGFIAVVSFGLHETVAAAGALLVDLHSLCESTVQAQGTSKRDQRQGADLLAW